MFTTYIPISYNIVLPPDISIIASLLSLEKFLSKYSPNSPTIPKNSPVYPTLFPIINYNIMPIIKPLIPPNFFPANSPINNTNITNRFGCIPRIVNHEKKLI